MFLLRFGDYVEGWNQQMVNFAILTGDRGEVPDELKP